MQSLAKVWKSKRMTKQLYGGSDCIPSIILSTFSFSPHLFPTCPLEMGCCGSNSADGTASRSHPKYIGDAWLSEVKSGKATTASRSTVPAKSPTSSCLQDSQGLGKCAWGAGSEWSSNDNLSNQPACGSPQYDPVKPFQDFSDDDSQGSGKLSETVDLHGDPLDSTAAFSDIPISDETLRRLEMFRHASLVGVEHDEPSDPQWWSEEGVLSSKQSPPNVDERNYHQDVDTNDHPNPTSIRVVWQVRKWLAGVEQPLRRGYVE